MVNIQISIGRTYFVCGKWIFLNNVKINNAENYSDFLANETGISQNLRTDHTAKQKKTLESLKEKEIDVPT